VDFAQHLGTIHRRTCDHRRVDLNADVGEGFDTDDELLKIITSANVACGFHAGDPLTMRRVCDLAAARAVVIGAQVGYHDLAGFGRRRMDVAPDVLAAEVLYQLGALEACARAAGTSVRYVKLHGALYNTAMDDPVQAAAVVEAIASYDRSLPLLGLPDSSLSHEAANRGVPYFIEAFADRRYTSAGRLVDRSEPGALLTDPDEVVAQAVSIMRDRSVRTVDGVVEISADSICLHGDTPGAVRLAELVRDALGADSLRSFLT
jgi:UPF0271 protein